jgi:iron complex outermembrane receptor protein
MGKLVAPLVLGLLLAVGSALAESGDSPGVDDPQGAGRNDSLRVYDPEAVGLDTVRVHAIRPLLARRWLRATPLVSVRDLETARPGEDFASFLSGLPGLQVRRYGALGAFSTASLRGASPNQVPVYWDGIPLLLASEGILNLSSIPLPPEGRVEVYRSGVPPNLMGMPAVGAVHIVPTSPADADGMRFSATLGSYGTRASSAAGALGMGSLALRWNLGTLESRGDFPYLDRGGTPENPEDDRILRRGNNAVRQSDYGLRLRWSLPRAVLTLASQGINREAGIPPPEGLPAGSVSDRYDRRLHVARLESAKPVWGRLDLALEASLQEIRDRFANPRGEVGLGRADWDHRTRSASWGGQAHLRWLGGERSLHVGWQTRRERFRPRDRLHDRTGPTQSRATTSVLLEDRWHLLGDRLLVALGYRWIRATDTFAGSRLPGRPPEPLPPRMHRLSGPQLGLRADLGHGLVLKANRTWTGRLPTFYELFGQNGIQDANPELLPEVGWQADLGLLWSPPGWLLEVVLLRNETRRRITWIQNSQRTTKAINLGATRTDGLEFSLQMRRPPSPRGWSWGLRATATLLDARDVGPSPLYRGKRVPYVSPATLLVGCWVRRGPWELTYEVLHEGATYRDRYNSAAHRTPARTLHDLGLVRWLLGRRLSVALRIANLTDARTVDMEGYPLPGRTWFLRLRWSLGGDETRDDS